MKTIAVLLTVHNRKDKTMHCLAKLYEQILPEGYVFEVYLTDDGSIDGTAEAIREQYPDVKIIQGDGSLYWNRGMHKAWQAALSTQNYDYYLWLNDDTNLNQDALNTLLKTLENGAGIVCGAVCSEKDYRFSYGGKDEKGNNIIPNGTTQECTIINGNCVLIHQNVYHKIGILDPIYPHAIGDFDYGLRAKKAGIVILTTPQYIGFCEPNAKLPKWCYSTTPFRDRMKALYSPLGNAHPYYFFIYENRHFGFITATKHFLSIHLRALIPTLWK